MAARKEHIAASDGTPAPEGHTPLSAFAAELYELTFLLDEALDDGVVVLLFDDDPEGDPGEAEPRADEPALAARH